MKRQLRPPLVATDPRADAFFATPKGQSCIAARRRETESDVFEREHAHIIYRGVQGLGALKSPT